MTYLNLRIQICFLDILFLMSNHLPLQNNVLSLTRSKAGSNHLLLFNFRGGFTNSIVIDLVENLCLEPLLLHLALVRLIVLLIYIVLDAIVMLLEYLRIELFCTGHLRLVACQGILPRFLLHRVIVLDYARVMGRLNVATIMEGLNDRR